MALSRKFLSALGIEADKVDEIIEAHAETVNALKAERDDFKIKADKVETMEKELKEAKAKIEASNTDGYARKYEDLKKEFDIYKADQEALKITATKDKAYRQMLIEAGISEKRIDAIMKVTDLSKVELDGDNLKDADKLAESVKKEWADFLTQEHREGAGSDNPPPDGGEGGSPKPIPTLI